MDPDDSEMGEGKHPQAGQEGPDGLPDVPSPVTALPSVGARLVAFALILLAGAAGGFIGFSFVDLQCEGDCSTANGLGALVGAVIGAVGVAVVTVLALRAMGEWRARGGSAGRAARVASRPSKPPRVQ